MSSAAWLGIIYGSLRQQGHLHSMLGTPPGCPIPQGHHRCHMHPLHQALLSTLRQQGWASKLTASHPISKRRKSEAHGETPLPRSHRAGHGGWGEPEPLYAQYSLTPTPPPSLASQGAELSFPGKAGRPERLVLVDLWGQSLGSLGKAQVQAVWTADLWSPEPLRSGLKGAGSRLEQGIQS